MLVCGGTAAQIVEGLCILGRRKERRKETVMKIGIIEGSVREGRAAPAVARWVEEGAAGRPGVELVHINLADFNLPLLYEPVPPVMLNRQYDSEAARAWSQVIDSCDGFIFVAPEYNRSISGALKNAIDWLAPEWMNKVAAVVGYGSDGGPRGIEQLRMVLANFNMYVIRSQVSLSIFTDLVDGVLQPNEIKQGDLTTMVDQLVETIDRVRA